MCSVCARGYVQGPDDVHNLLYCMIMEGKIGIYQGKYTKVGEINDSDGQPQERRVKTKQEA